ncbi:hypothetical protein RFI_10452, partial [Reticulomyxa filosa]
MGNINKGTENQNPQITPEIAPTPQQQLTGVHLPDAKEFETQKRGRYHKVIAYWSRCSFSEEITKPENKRKDEKVKKRPQRSIAMRNLREYPTDLVELIVKFVPYFLHSKQSAILRSNLKFQNKPLYEQFPKPSFNVVLEALATKQMVKHTIKRSKSVKRTEILMDSQSICDILIVGTELSGKKTLFKQFHEIYSPFRDKFNDIDQSYTPYGIHEISEQ